MPGNDLQQDALNIALRYADPDIGVAVFCQMVNAPNLVKGHKGGAVPVWHLLLTLANPADLTGPRLRAYTPIGHGAPDLSVIKPYVEASVLELRQMARAKLAQAQ